MIRIKTGSDTYRIRINVSSSLMGSLAKGVFAESLRKFCGKFAEICKEMRFIAPGKGAEIPRKVRGNLRKIFCNDPFPNDPIPPFLQRHRCDALPCFAASPRKLFDIARIAFPPLLPFSFRHKLIMVSCTKQQEIHQESQRNNVVPSIARWPLQTQTQMQRCSALSFPIFQKFHGIGGVGPKGPKIEKI